MVLIIVFDLTILSEFMGPLFSLRRPVCQATGRSSRWNYPARSDIGRNALADFDQLLCTLHLGHERSHVRSRRSSQRDVVRSCKTRDQKHVAFSPANSRNRLHLRDRGSDDLLLDQVAIPPPLHARSERWFFIPEIAARGI